MNTLKTCEACGEGRLHPRIDRFLMEYKGSSQDLVRHHHVCNECKGDYTLPEDLRANRREVIRFQKMVEAIPLGCEIRDMRLNAGLSQQEAGILFGGGPTAFSKYEADDLVPNEAMVNLIKLAMVDDTVVKRLRNLKGVHLRATVVRDHSASQVGAMEWQSAATVIHGHGASTYGAAVTGRGYYDLEAGWNQ